MMEIISHRGLWNDSIKKNSPESFLKSFELSFGTETDIRDYNGGIVISHDIADKHCLGVSSFFKIYNSFPQKKLALNIKADGLAEKMNEIIRINNINNYFFFDMSIPDTISYLKFGLNVFIRQSEYEKDLPFYKECKGIWLDSFINNWYGKDIINQHLNNDKYVCIVSSELHKRNPASLWNFIKESKLHLEEKLIICTDQPLEALKYFYND